MIKKICIIVLSRANYSSIKSVMKKIKKSKDLKLQLIVGASALSEKFGSIVNQIQKDGFKINYKININVSGSDTKEMPHAVGMGLIELPNILEKLRPDLVFTVGDRYETICSVISSSYMNIPVAHTMGGEITGTIDESVRHAVTKLSHLHFVSNQDARKRVIRLGENSRFVFNVGCPRIDEIKEILKNYKEKTIFKKLNKIGVGSKIFSKDKFIIMCYHPVTSEFNSNFKNTEIILRAIANTNYKCLALWPNPDAGSDLISKKIRQFRENNLSINFRFIKNLPLEVFVPLMDRAECIVGNSSAAIRDCAFIGTPALNLGTRQNKRLKGKNVISTNKFDVRNIVKLINKQIKKKKFKSEKIYGDGKAAERIVKTLESIKQINTQKTITY